MATAINVMLFVIGVVSLVTFKNMCANDMAACQLTHSYDTCYTALNR